MSLDRPYVVKLYDHRCDACGKYWLSEREFEWKCAPCEAARANRLLAEAAKLERSIRGLRAAFKRRKS